ncbi:MAG TPA: vanadium-dependent haloperoxidase, partial [Gemmatimonadaceae bacterium]|nr:vanadium-dependent haloperoxidase [Gemmatimonadaceae bacterium]
SLSGRLNTLPDLPRAERKGQYDETITSIAAERTLLDSMLREALPTVRAAIARLADSLETARTSTGLDADTKSRSEDLGRRVANTLVAWAHADGFDTTRGRKYVAPIGPGLWINDSPASTYTSRNESGASQAVAVDNPANALRAGSASDRDLILNRTKRAGGSLPALNMAGATEPYWGYIRPFVLQHWNECPANKPPPFSITPGSTMYEDAKVVYDVHAKLTPEQKTTALYWADNPGESGTPAGHWVSISSQVSNAHGRSAAQAARAMVTTSIALADAFIATWGYKYQVNLIRPRTYIRAVMDSTWEPAIPTPPFPEFLAGHATISAAAAAALTAELGAIAFDDSTSIALGHTVRHFDSFKAAANEAAMSRLYGGIHFPSGNNGGRTLGECVGAKVVERLKVDRSY